MQGESFAENNVHPEPLMSAVRFRTDEGFAQIESCSTDNDPATAFAVGVHRRLIHEGDFSHVGERMDFDTGLDGCRIKLGFAGGRDRDKIYLSTHRAELRVPCL